MLNFDFKFKYVTPLAILTIFTVLTGCTYHENDYLHEAKTMHPVLAEGMKIKKGEGYYPVPNIPTKTVAKAPSLVPPGSNLQRFQHKVKQPKKAKSRKKRFAQFEKASNGAQALLLAAKRSIAWKRVGKALQSMSYQVLDQDSSMGSYYILDKKSTGNKITKTTPIYRIYLKASGSDTIVMLLNEKNKPASTEANQRILGALQQKLT